MTIRIELERITRVSSVIAAVVFGIIYAILAYDINYFFLGASLACVAVWFLFALIQFAIIPIVRYVLKGFENDTK